MSDVRTVRPGTVLEALVAVTGLPEIEALGTLLERPAAGLLLDLPLIGPNHDAVLDGVTVEELDRECWIAYDRAVTGRSREQAGERWDAPRDITPQVRVEVSAIRNAILSRIGVAIPEGYGTVCGPTWPCNGDGTSNSDGTSNYHAVETLATGDGYKASMGQRVAFLGKKEE